MINKDTGEKQRTIMKEFRLMEISAVDRPAQAEAKMSIMKRAEEPVVKVLETAVTTQQDGHAHILVGLQARREGLAEVTSGLTSFADGHAHAWARDEAGNIIIADEAGHTHQIAAMMTKELAPEESAAPEAANQPAGEPAEKLGDSGEDNMSDQNGKAADPAVTPEQLDALTKRLEKAERFGQLNDAEKAHYNSLNETDQAEFLAEDAEGRAEVLKALQDKDPVVFKCEDGTEIRKSQDPSGLLAKQAKELEEERKRRKQMEEKAQKADLEKRAGELPLTGDMEARTLVLKAIDSLPEDERAKASEVLKANVERLQTALKKIGTTDSGSPEADPIEDIAKRLRAETPTLSPEQAYSKALETPEGQAAFAKMRSN